jgi:hypothetical protein
MELLHWIAQACDQLSVTAAPTLNAVGLRMVLSLATIMMVWFGVQEALASAHGGLGFNMGRFLNFFMLMTFAYVMVKYYDTTIPGLSFSLRSLIRDGSNGIVSTLGTDQASNMMDSIAGILARGGPGMAIFTAPYTLIVYVTVQLLLGLLAALSTAVLAYGAVGSAVVGLLGPIFIPFLVVKQLEFLFWGWFKAFLSFAFYKVVAAAVMTVLSNIYMNYYANLVNFQNPVSLIQNFPILLILILVNIFILTKIPAMVVSIFSGHTGGHDAGMGIATGLALRRGL